MYTFTRSGYWGHNFCLVLLALATTAAAESRQDKVAASGDAVPGVTDATFSLFDQPVINDEGEVAFSSHIGGPGIFSSSDRGIWSTGGGGDLTLVAREGAGAVPGVTGADYSDFGLPILNDDGDVAFNASMKFTGGVTAADNDGIWASSGGILGLVVREGVTPAPGLPTHVIAPLSTDRTRFNNSGAISLAPRLREGAITDGTGLVTDASGSLAMLARTGVVAGAPGVSPSGSFSSFSRTVFNNLGELAFQAGLSGIPLDENSGIWSTIGGTLDIVVQEGNTAPGAGSAKFESFNEPSISDSSELAFIAELETGGSVDATNDTGIWAGPRTSLALIAREGSGGVPGIPGASFTHFLDGPVINSEGAIAFSNSLEIDGDIVTGLDNSGVWSSGSGTLELVAREGSGGVPGVPGAHFGSFRHETLNDVGMVAFESFLQNASGGVNSSNDLGIWVFGPDGEGLLVARELDPLDGKTIRRAEIVNGLNNGGMSGGSDGRRRALNNYGQIVYRVEFSDNSQGVYTFTPDLHWTAPGSGDWDTNTNWTFWLDPAKVHDVFIDPAASLTVTGPASDTTVRSLEIGGGGGTATLATAAGATLTATLGTQITTGGVLAGSGTVAGTVTNDGGTVAPGDSPGELTLSDSYLQTATGTYEAEVSSTTPGSGHDTLSVGGTATLAGTLSVVPTGGYADPATRGSSDTFVLLTAASRSGTFDTVEYDSTPLSADFTDGDSFRSHQGDGLFRNVGYTATDVALTNLLAAAGDANGDGIVSASTDGALLLANLGGGDGKTWIDGDFDGDGSVTASADGGALLAGLSGDAGTAAVPEPHSLLLLLLFGLLGTLAPRRATSSSL